MSDPRPRAQRQSAHDPASTDAAIAPASDATAPRPAPWLIQLEAQLQQLAAVHQRRSLRVVEGPGPIVRLDGRDLVNLASNDYLGLSQHPHVRQAAMAAIETWGVGSGSSRLLGGHLAIHQQVESRFARWKHAQAALLCPTGYLANHAVLTALARRGDTVLLDKLCHASLIDAARASGATVRTFPHRDYGRLKRLLERRTQGESQGPGALEPRLFIVSDSVFSMDGDCADVPALCRLRDRHGAILIIDEAHGSGILGPDGSGLCAAQGVADRVDIVISTASKALGGLGGVVSGPRGIIDTLINHARSFIYTTAVPPAQAAAIDAALDVIRDEPWRRQRLQDMTRRVRAELSQLGLAPPAADGPGDPLVPIVPIVVGGSQAAVALAARLESAGFLAPAIRPPTVARGAARVRISLRADLHDAHLDALLSALTAARVVLKP